MGFALPEPQNFQDFGPLADRAVGIAMFYPTKKLPRRSGARLVYKVVCWMFAK